MHKLFSPLPNLYGGLIDSNEQETLELLESRTETATLSVHAGEAFAHFCQTIGTCQWSPLVTSVEPSQKNKNGLYTQVKLGAQTHSGVADYTLLYRYDSERHRVSWKSEPGSGRLPLAGSAQFIRIADNACMMQYELALEIPTGLCKPWGDPIFHSGAAGAVVEEFRNYLRRYSGK